MLTLPLTLLSKWCHNNLFNTVKKAYTGKFTVQFPVRARNCLFPENVNIGSWNQQALIQWVEFVLSQGVKRLGCHPQLVQTLGMSTAILLILCASMASTKITSPLLFTM
jgi:hypothetical protein